MVKGRDTGGRPLGVWGIELREPPMLSFKDCLLDGKARPSPSWEGVPEDMLDMSRRLGYVSKN